MKAYFRFFKLRMRLAAVLFFAILLAAVAPSALYSEEKTVKIGVLANRGVSQAIKDWLVTADYLTSQLPQYTFVIVPLYSGDIGPAVNEGKIDFLLTNSSMYVEMEAMYGVSRISTLVKRRAGVDYTVYGEVIFTRADREDINELKDLRGKSLIATDEASFGGFQMTWRELKENGININRDLTMYHFSEFSQDNVVYAVRDGEADAGTVRTGILESMADEGKIDLADFRVLNPQQNEGFPLLHSTRLYPEWPLAKVKHTSDDLARKVAIALLNMQPDSQAAKAAGIAGWTIPLDYQPVHECLMELQAGPYKDFGRITPYGVVRQYWYLLVLSTAVFFFMATATLYVQRTNRRLRQSRQESELLACTDYLTGLLNRRAFMDRFEAEVSRAKRERTPLGLILADIDHFKRTNDTYGHQMGDVVLQKFAECISRLSRSYDFIGRYGGEEFIICLPGASREQLSSIAERMRKVVYDQLVPLSDNSEFVTITASFGVASLEGGVEESVDSLIKKADEALYRAKAEGRNRVCQA